MIGGNGIRQFLLPRLIFCFIDSLLTATALLVASFIRFKLEPVHVFEVEYLLLKTMVIVVIVQIAFYYFDLHEFRIFRERKKMLLLLSGSMGVSSILLGVIYYISPLVSIGRGVFAISLFAILIFSFGWRVFFAWLTKGKILKERVLIVGTGELATKIKKEITENGYDDFEIIGFIDENGERVGKTI